MFFIDQLQSLDPVVNVVRQDLDYLLFGRRQVLRIDVHGHRLGAAATVGIIIFLLDPVLSCYLSSWKGNFVAIFGFQSTASVPGRRPSSSIRSIPVGLRPMLEEGRLPGTEAVDGIKQ